MRGARAAGTRAHGNHRNVESREHVIRVVSVVDSGGHGSAEAPWIADAERLLSAKTGDGRVDRYDESDRAAGRFRLVGRAYQCRTTRRSLPALRSEDLHHLG